jgi:hypothetical protein
MLRRSSLSVPRICTYCLAWIVLAALPAYAAESSYLSVDQFIAEAFASQPSKASVLWVTKDIAAQAAKILGHEAPQLRQHYWSDGTKSAWVLEEIGKEEPITAGFVVQDGHMLEVKVLAYRESRGGEVRYPAFLSQYIGVGLTADNHLNKNIDGISGATLSVHALERMARLALYYDHLAMQK